MYSGQYTLRDLVLNGGYRTKSPEISGTQSNLWSLNRDGHEVYDCTNLSFSTDEYDGEAGHSFYRIGIIIFLDLFWNKRCMLY